MILSPVAHIEDDDLTLFVSEKLDLEHSFSIQSHVRDCVACKERLLAGLLARLAELNQNAGNGSNERRVERRFDGVEHGYLQTLSPLSFERPAVQIVNSSENGLGLVTNSSLAKGTIVQICIGKDLVLGEVKSCRATDNDQFRLGIRVQNASGLKSKFR